MVTGGARPAQPRAFHFQYNLNEMWAATIVRAFLIPCGVNGVFQKHSVLLFSRLLNHSHLYALAHYPEYSPF